jgi:hypothetical protein
MVRPRCCPRLFSRRAIAIAACRGPPPPCLRRAAPLEPGQQQQQQQQQQRPRGACSTPPHPACHPQACTTRWRATAPPSTCCARSSPTSPARGASCARCAPLGNLPACLPAGRRAPSALPHACMCSAAERRSALTPLRRRLSPRQVLWNIDAGQAVNLAGIPDEPLRGMLEQLFGSLQLKQVSQVGRRGTLLHCAACWRTLRGRAWQARGDPSAGPPQVLSASAAGTSVPWQVADPARLLTTQASCGRPPPCRASSAAPAAASPCCSCWAWCSARTSGRRRGLRPRPSSSSSSRRRHGSRRRGSRSRSSSPAAAAPRPRRAQRKARRRLQRALSRRRQQQQQQQQQRARQTARSSRSWRQTVLLVQQQGRRRRQQ